MSGTSTVPGGELQMSSSHDRNESSVSFLRGKSKRHLHPCVVRVRFRKCQTDIFGYRPDNYGSAGPCFCAAAEPPRQFPTGPMALLLVQLIWSLSPSTALRARRSWHCPTEGGVNALCKLIETLQLFYSCEQLAKFLYKRNGEIFR